MTSHPSDADFMAAEVPPQLDQGDPAARAAARVNPQIRQSAVPGDDAPTAGWVNLHAHTIYSYNAYGYTPTGFAWRARRSGLAAAGIVDFDVLDAVDEFLDAGRAFGLKTVAGLETRVFVPEFSSRVINSPGEPGISYHMGMGFSASAVPEDRQSFLAGLRRTSERRNRELVRRVNAALEPASLDYDADVLPLTPAGNATERHICLAYARKAALRFPNRDALAAFWKRALGEADMDLPEGPRLLNRIRSRTMKRGGIGYVVPDSGAFPSLADTNRFILACGALPTLTWLDGTSEGEQALEDLFDVFLSAGTAAANIVPDRNFTPGHPDARLENLTRFVEACRRRHLPLIAGTEMNAPGNRFVDRFSAAELAPFLQDFLKGGWFFFAHTVLQSRFGLGCAGAWAKSRFRTLEDRNEFFTDLGKTLPAEAWRRLPALPEDPTPDAVRDCARKIASAETP